MAITQLDDVAALVVIDMQKGIVGLPTAHPIDGVIANVASLAKAFRARNLPVVLVNVMGRAPGRVEQSRAFAPAADWAVLIPELDEHPSDLRITKMTINAFYGTGLDMLLRRAKATQIFMTGVATGSGVEATARNGYDHGYNVVAVTDAMTDMNIASHDHAVEVTFPRIAETGTTAEVLALLGKR